MRTQQRSFVVEIKSPRRRLKTQPKSIWGNTDFAALVKDTEASLPFMQNSSSETPLGIENEPVEPKKQIEVTNLSEVAERQLSTIPLIIADQIESDKQDAVSADLPVLKTSVRQLKSRTVQTPKHRRARNARDLSATVPAVTAIDVAETRSDDLASLETENRRLKRLLAQYLAQQNEQLWEMLQRFEMPDGEI